MAEAVKRMGAIIGDMQTRRVAAGITEALLYVGAASAKEVPVDTSTLLNSQYREIETRGHLITGKIGYSAKYAARVHNAPGKYLNTQTDRPVGRGEMPGSHGVIWGPNGNPKFLYWPLEDAKNDIRVILRRALQDA